MNMRRLNLPFVCLLLVTLAAKAADRPNILWITSEDNSPYLGCYGDPLAVTPHLDRLAAQGVRYRRAFANAPVCSTARSTLITGMHASSLGVHHHRSSVAIPERFKLYPEHLRAAGYYCSNNSKTDYNVAGKRSPWDESSNKAHYRNRAPGQAFFAVFNFATSHESQVAPNPGKATFRVPPEKIPLPPYHPDTLEIRRDWANYYEGRPFLGGKKAAPREHVFLFRGRMDERYDTVRAVREGEFRYVRNYSPHRPWGQHYAYPFQVQPSMRSWFAEFTAGRCNEVQSAYWKPKPGEEFYEIAGDPFELRNRIAEPEHAARIAKLRAALRAEILATRDTGFIPEGMFPKLAGGKTIYDYARSGAYPLARILDLADKASDRNAAHLPAFVAALDDPHPVIRYWAAAGCLILADKAEPAKAKLRELLNDEWPDMRVVAAEALAHLGEREAAVKTIADVLTTGNLHEALAAQNALDFLWQAGFVPLVQAQDLVRDLKFGEPGDRIPRYLLSQP